MRQFGAYFTSVKRKRRQERVAPTPRPPRPPRPLMITIRGKTSEAERKRRKKEFLFGQQRGLCHWCSGPMVLLEPQPQRRDPPANEATLEHLRSRLHPERSAPTRGERRQVLACRACNNERGRAEYMTLPLEERQRRAQNGL